MRKVVAYLTTEEEIQNAGENILDDCPVECVGTLPDGEEVLISLRPGDPLDFAYLDEEDDNG